MLKLSLLSLKSSSELCLILDGSVVGSNLCSFKACELVDERQHWKLLVKLVLVYADIGNIRDGIPYHFSCFFIKFINGL